MRRVLAVLAVLFAAGGGFTWYRAHGCCSPIVLPMPAVHVPAGWRTLKDGTLSLTAPPGTTLKRSDGIDSTSWTVSNPRFGATLRFGFFVPDLRDEEANARCFTSERAIIDGQRATILTGRGFPMMDCPERSSFLAVVQEYPNGAQGRRLYAETEAKAQNDLASVRLVYLTLHMAGW